jgi:autotransporter-associated beta strand protein
VTGANTYNIGGLQGADSLSIGNNTISIGVNNASTTYSGSISGTGNLVKTGSGNLTLNAANTFNGTITINTGTLIAGSAGALGLTSNITVNNGGSLFVAANDAFENSANVTLNGTSATLPTLQFSGNYNGSISSLTLTGNSIIDLGTGSVVIDLGVIKGLETYSLKIYNWSGQTLWSGNSGTGTDRIYGKRSDGANGFTSFTSSELANISFYTSSFSQGLTSGFSGSGFQNSVGGEIYGVPEPSTYVLGLLLLSGMGVYYLRKRVFSFQCSVFSRDTANKGGTVVSSVDGSGPATSTMGERRFAPEKWVMRIEA